MSNIGERIKRYEWASNYSLTPRSCLFIRIDGKAFHTFTRGCDKPFDQKLIDSMVQAGIDTAKEMMGFKLAYLQSDECTFMLTDFDTLQTQGWFGYELNKIVSVSASMFTAYFNRAYGSDNAIFDSRAFIVPEDDAPNVFIWRQRDWERNSIQMLSRSHFSHSELNKKKVPEMHNMLHQKGVNWSELNDQLKNGTFITKDFELLHNKMDYEQINNILTQSRKANNE